MMMMRKEMRNVARGDDVRREARKKMEEAVSSGEDCNPASECAV